MCVYIVQFILGFIYLYIYTGGISYLIHKNNNVWKSYMVRKGIYSLKTFKKLFNHYSTADNL